MYEVNMDAQGAPTGVENIGTPFNSPKDDFSLVMNELKSEGYFTSARDGGHGQDDIYSFKTIGKVMPEATICAYEVGTDKRLEGVEVIINDDATANGDHVLKLVETTENDEYILKFSSNDEGMNEESMTKLTNDAGVFKMTVTPNVDYAMVAKKDGYKVANESMMASSTMLSSNDEFCIPMEPMNCLVMEGIVKNKKYKNKMIPNASVTMVNKCTGDEVVVKSDSNGDFNFPCVDCDCEYFLKGEKSYFTEGTNTASTMGLNCSAGGKVEVVLELNPVDPAAPIVTAPLAIAPSLNGNTIREGAVIELPQIYYDFDQFYIRDDASNELDRVVSLMNQHPTLTIELGSHTDARGTVKYNETLSQNRANAAVKYIVSKGIGSARLVAKGYGESQLRNRCENFVECPEEEHQYNRRTEVRVLRFNDPNTDVKYLGNMPVKIDRADPNRKWIWN